MDTTILALDVEAEADKLVEILSTTEGMRSVAEGGTPGPALG